MVKIQQQSRDGTIISLLTTTLYWNKREIVIPSQGGLVGHSQAMR